MEKHRVAHLGLGPRGITHADAVLELKDRFELVGLCELNEERLGKYVQEKS
ncbi:gfo/Idh/MocA family oxidoreductase, partial [bacterium]|nr:gfo/Idh/MocA family oxidoreductase [bacterium]